MYMYVAFTITGINLGNKRYVDGTAVTYQKASYNICYSLHLTVIVGIKVFLYLFKCHHFSTFGLKD